MSTRPTAYPYWTDGASPSKVVTPDGASALQGFTAGEPPPFQYVNYLFYTISSWIQYLDQITNTGLNNALIRLVNGGIWSFNATSGALAWSADANLAIPSIPDSSNRIPAGSVTLNDGDVAYCVANMPTSSQGSTNTVTNPDEIIGMNFTGNVQVGDNVTGPGIPANTTVLGVAPNSVLLSNNVTSDNTNATYVFSLAGPISVQTSASTALVPQLNTILLARRAGNVVYLGVNCAQMVLRDKEFKSLIGSGYFSLYQAPAGQNLAAGTMVYASVGSADGGRTAGALYPLDVSAVNQGLRGTYAGVVITAVTTGQTAQALYSGFYLQTGLVAGDTYFADPANPGGFTNVMPSGSGQKIVAVGYAVSPTSMLFTGTAAGPELPTAFPIFNAEFLQNTGDNQHYTMSTTPLTQGAVFLSANGVLITENLWTLAGNTVDFGSPQSPTFKPYAVYLLAGQSYLSGNQGLAANPSGDRQTFVVQGSPTNKPSTFVWVNGLQVDGSKWTLSIGGTQSEVIFNAPLTISEAASVYVGFFSSVAPVLNPLDLTNISVDPQPVTDASQKLGTPAKGWAGLVVKDTATSQHYEIVVTNGVLQVNAVP